MEQRLGKSSEDVLTPPLRGGRSLTSQQKQSLDLSRQIPGWGSDLDPSVRPGVPMDPAPMLGIETLYPDFEQQVPRYKVHKSTEHAKLTPVFGNACPPRGVSGMLRDLAYSYSEGKMQHWLLLLTADRIDVVEEFFVDIAQLKIPNIPHEMGLASEFKYNKKGVAKKVAVFAALGFAYYAFSRSRQTVLRSSHANKTDGIFFKTKGAPKHSHA
jgi:hypothetical protein